MGEYLFISSRQHFAIDPGLQVVYRWGDSAVVKKATVPERVKSTETLGRFGETLALVDYVLGAQTVRAGDVISLTAQIETLHVPDRELAWRLQLRDLENNAVAEKRSSIFGNKYPLQRWPDGRVLPQGILLPLPSDVRPGLYDLQLGLYAVSNGQPEPFRTVEGTEDDVIHLGRVKVKLAPVSPDELAAATHMDAKLGSAFQLIGYRLANRTQIRPGDSIKLYLYWWSVQTVPQDYTVFVHLLDSQGALRAQQDTAPRGGTYPTSIWEANEIVVDPYTLTVPPGAAPGDYSIEIGMYAWPSLARLPVTLQGGGAMQDHLILPEKVSVIAR